jgi:tetratricopeptide (TPR) repeat protein
MQSLSRPLAAFLFVVCFSCATAGSESDLAVARRFAAAGNWKEAEQHARLHMQIEPQDGDAAVLHAEALIHLGQPFDAVLEMERLLESHPDHVGGLKLYAALLVDVVHESSRAQPVLAKAAALAPKDWEVWEALGKLHFRLRKPEEAVRAFRTACGLAPSNPELASELARALDEIDDAGQAEAQHRRALRLNQELERPLSGVYVRFATFLSNRNRLNESLRAFNEALRIDAHSADALYGRAVAQEKAGNLHGAEADALAALRESPARRDARQLLIRVYRGLGDNAKVDEQVAAIKTLADAEQAETARFREMHRALNSAERLLAEGKLGEAIAPYEKVVELSPAFYEAWFALGICYSQTGDAARGESALKRYLGFQPLSADGHAALGLLLFGAKRSAEAGSELSRAVELAPELEEPRTALAKLALDGREYQRALSLLEPLLARTDGADADAYSIGATARFLLGRREEALALCEEGLRRHPDSVKLEERHVSFLIACGRTEACRLRAAHWYSLRPNSPRYLRCVAELLLLNNPLDDETERAIRRIAAEHPQEAYSHYLLGKWARARSRHAMARDEALQACALAGTDERIEVQCLTLEGLAREALTEFNAAEAAFQKAWNVNRRLDPPSAEEAMWYVDFLLAAGRNEEASARAREVLGWDPRHGPAHLVLARVLENAGRRGEAAGEAEMALRCPTDDSQQVRAVHALLAKLYYALGRNQEARVHEAWIRAH